MDKILLLANDNPNDLMLTNLKNSSHFDIYETHNTKKALKMIKKHSPDFVLCAGTILQDEEGRYFLDLS